ncbi:hypothetical protein OBBRIDRAFT_788769 [Obba rivulosa]|uniref:Uncharacterized protein n=1 Tax=Obba rivulosa TaxID=1052685 RepID=A0A8E2J7B5_9APHY|nr:hypothetical protein OBBRIDRAFT_788769 [Obba rivulosa]
MARFFLCQRLAFLAFLGFLDVLVGFFAVWEIMLFKGGEITVNPEPIFVLFNSCLLIVLLAFVTFDHFGFPIGISQVRYEFAWIFISSILHLVSAIDNTTFGPPLLCNSQVPVSLCASSLLLVVLTWLSSSILVVYLLMLTTSVAAHRRIPAIWRASVYAVPWFMSPLLPISNDQRPPKTRARESTTWAGHPVWSAHEDENDAQEVPLTPPGLLRDPSVSEKTPDSSSGPRAGSVNSQGRRPQWAKKIALRRGLDQPFAVRIPPTPFEKSVWSATTARGTPRPPPKCATRSDLGPFADQGEYAVDPNRDTLTLPTIPPSRPLSYGVFSSWDGSRCSRDTVPSQWA